MDMKALGAMVSSLQNDGGLVDKFQKNPVAVIEEFLGIDLPDEQVNGLIAGIKSNLLGQKDETASAATSGGMDFGSIIKSLSGGLDVNGDGKVGLDDLMGIASGLSKSDSKGDDTVENLLKSFKI